MAPLALPVLAMAATLVFFQYMGDKIARGAHVFPLDGYFYQSMAASLRRGEGPRTEWPQGPQNKYFPGFAYWWAIFLPADAAPEQAMRSYPPAQTVLLALLMAAGAALGWVLWRDWMQALAFAALTAGSPLALKWGAFPLSELMAAAAVTGMAAVAMALSGGRRPSGADDPSAPPARGARTQPTGIALLAALGAVAVVTRPETVYVLAVLVGWIVVRRKLRWSFGLVVLGVAVLPVALWQLWVRLAFNQVSTYIAEGAAQFRWSEVLGRFFFLALQMIYVPYAAGPILPVNFFMTVVAMLLLAALFVALRGYLGEALCVSAWLLMGYWLAHGFWYYQTERYNVPVLAFAFAILVEGTGRLYNLREGWKARGGRWILAVCTVVVLGAFARHAWDNCGATITVLNEQTFPDNQRAIERVMQGERGARAGERPVILTNLSLPEARRLPGIVWLETPDYLPRTYEPGGARAFMSAHGVTHLALRPPAAEWLAREAPDLATRPLYEDGMVWIARVGTSR